MAAVAEHGEALAEAAHLRHAVRDEDDGHALRIEPLDERAQPVHVGGRQRRGGLVQQQHPGLARDCLGDLDLLAGGQREVAHHRVGVHVLEAETGEVLDDGALAPAPVDLACHQRLVGQQHVLRDGHIVDQGHFLKCRLNAEHVGTGRASNGHIVAEHVNAAGILADQPGQDLDEGGLAGAVLADQRADLALRDGKRYVVEGDGRVEPLGEALDLDGGRRIVHACPRGGKRAGAEPGSGPAPALRSSGIMADEPPIPQDSSSSFPSVAARKPSSGTCGDQKSMA